MYLKYLIPPNYRTVRLSFSKILGKLVVKYVPTYNKSTLKKSAKDLSNDAYAMFFFSDFLHKSIFCGYSFELYEQVDAIQIGIPQNCSRSTLFAIQLLLLLAISSNCQVDFMAFASLHGCCMVVNPIMVDSFPSLFIVGQTRIIFSVCTTVRRSSD